MMHDVQDLSTPVSLSAPISCLSSERLAIISEMATDSNYPQLSPDISLMSHLQSDMSKPETRRSRVVASKSVNVRKIILPINNKSRTKVFH